MRLHFEKGLQLLGDKALAQHFEGALKNVGKIIERDGVFSIDKKQREEISLQVMTQIDCWRQEKCFVGAVTYGKAIRVVGSIGKGFQVIKLMNLMKKDGYHSRQWIYEHLAMNHAREGNLGGVQKCLSDILKNGWRCSSSMYDAAFICFGILQDDDQILKVFNTMCKSGVSVTETTLSSSLKSCSHPDTARQLFVMFEDLHITKPIQIYNNMLLVYLKYLTPPDRQSKAISLTKKTTLSDDQRQQERKKAQYFFRHEIPLEKNTTTYNMMLKIDSLFSDVNQVVTTYKMMSQNNIKPNVQTHMTIIRCVADALNKPILQSSSSSLVNIAKAAYKVASMQPGYRNSTHLRLKLAEVFSNAGMVTKLEQLMTDTKTGEVSNRKLHPAFNIYLEKAKQKSVKATNA